MISFFFSLFIKRLFVGNTLLIKLFVESFSIVFTIVVVYYASESFSVKPMLAGSEESSLFVFLVVGEISLLLAMSFSERIFAHFLEIRHLQFYQTLLGLRISPNQFILSTALSDALFPLFRVSFILIFITLFMDFPLSFFNFLIFCFIQIIAILIFTLMALITTLIYLKLNRGIGFFYTLQSIAAMAGGMYFPTTVFPAHFKNASFFLPQTQILAASRLIFQGKLFELNSLLILLAWLFLLLVIWLVLRRFLIKNLKMNARFF